MTHRDKSFVPNFDLAEFRFAVARFVKLLIRSRWRCEPGFLSPADLSAWGLSDISTDRLSAAALLDQAANTLAHLNLNFLPRCGSGGVKETDTTTPEGRLIEAVVILVPSGGGGPEHNGDLCLAVETLKTHPGLDWKRLVDWDALPSIRADLDLLPQTKNESTQLEKINSQLATLVNRETKKDWYTTDEFARLTNKAEFTVREWCRLGRVEAEKRGSGRGRFLAWVISHDELLRYQREGLRPLAVK
jgi:hypothetical protein